MRKKNSDRPHPSSISHRLKPAAFTHIERHEYQIKTAEGMPDRRASLPEDKPWITKEAFLEVAFDEYEKVWYVYEVILDDKNGDPTIEYLGVFFHEHIAKSFALDIAQECMDSFKANDFEDFKRKRQNP